MNARATNRWLRLGLDSWRLGAEAQGVIALRLMRIAGGGEVAARETELMVAEKIKTLNEVQTQMLTSLMTGSGHLAPQRTVTQYRRKVRANARRLTKSA